MPKADERTSIYNIYKAVFAYAPAMPIFSSRHLALIRNLRVVWIPMEAGAFSIHPRHPLLGSKPTITEAKAILGTNSEELAIRTLAEISLLIPDFVFHGTLAPGHYKTPEAMHETFSDPRSGVDATGHFEIKQEHLTLLKALTWIDLSSQAAEEALHEKEEVWPMPVTDGKRPYGPSSYYQFDMAKILGEPYLVDKNDEVVSDPDKDARFEKLHMSMLAALQVFLQNAVPGTAS